MNYKELIKQYVDTGISIPESQYLKLSSNDKKTYIRKRIIAVEYNWNINDLKEYEFSQLNEEEILKLKDKSFLSLIGNSINPKKTVISLLKMTKISQKISNMIENVEDKDIKYYLHITPNPNDFISVLGKKGKEYIDNLSDREIKYWLNESSIPDTVINNLLSIKIFEKKINSNILKYFMTRGKDIVQIINRLGQRAIDLIRNADSDTIYDLLDYQKNYNKEIMKNFLLKYGVSKELINDTIIKRKIQGISLIP